MNTQHGIPAPGHRLPARTRVGRVRLQVADAERSTRYYRDVLGLHPVERPDGRVALGPAGGSDPLVVLHEKVGATPLSPRSRLGLFHFAIRLPGRADLGAFLRHLADAGVRAGTSDHRVSEAVYLSDPDGLGIEIYADRPRSSWRQRDGELVMTTEPLDVASVVDEARDTRWDGMPEGTTMGHVHLHVGDLDAAATFYHDALGLDKVVWSYPGALFLSAGGYHHHLGLNTWAAGSAPAGPDDARLLEWELVLPDGDAVARAADSLGAAGYETEAEGVGAVIIDPWGIRLRIRAEVDSGA